MDDPYISRAEHEEFSRRLAEENKRQDKRIEMFEENVREMRALTNSVERLATSVEDMVKEQEKQGKRLEVLEGRDGVMMFFLSLMAMPSASARRYRLRLMSSSSSKELLITYPSSIYRPYPWMPRTSFT